MGPFWVEAVICTFTLSALFALFSMTDDSMQAVFKFLLISSADLLEGAIPNRWKSIGWNIFGYNIAKHPNIIAKTATVFIVVISILFVYKLLSGKSNAQSELNCSSQNLCILNFISSRLVPAGAPPNDQNLKFGEMISAHFRQIGKQIGFLAERTKYSRLKIQHYP